MELKYWEEAREKIVGMFKRNPYTNYVKESRSLEGDLIAWSFFASPEAEKKSFEYYHGFTVEEVELVNSLTEKQRKILLLQAQKEKIEKEIAALV